MNLAETAKAIKQKYQKNKRSEIWNRQEIGNHISDLFMCSFKSGSDWKEPAVCMICKPEINVV